MSSPPEPAPVQRVRIERRGGLAGRHLAVEREGSALTPAQRRAIDKLAQAGDVPTAATAQSTPAGADRFSYRITLDFADGQQRVLDLAEDELPSALAGLLGSAGG